MTKIAFTGDIAFTKHFSGSCEDEMLLGNDIVDFLSSSDYTVLNVEGAVSSTPASADKKLTHANPVECTDWFKKINGNIWTIANNHAMDCGAEGLLSTLEIAKEKNAVTVGAGMNSSEAEKPVIINENGGIGIISVTYLRNNKAENNSPGCFIATEEERVKKQIEEIKKKCRWCIVISHVGQEFSSLPMPYLRKRYKRYLKYGADIIIGHHPHVVQNYEQFGNKIVFYSLGNFIFDTDYQRIQKYTEYIMLIKINFGDDNFTWEYLPGEICRKTHRISSCPPSAIFRNIGKLEYNLLWPLAAKRFSLNTWKKLTFLHPEYKGRTWLGWLLKYDIKRCKTDVGRDTLLGRFLSIFHLWKLADKSLIEYISEK